jgi:hypothetical protein
MDQITIVCGQCNSQYRVAAKHAGKTVPCGKCKTPLLIPAATPLAQPTKLDVPKTAGAGHDAVTTDSSDDVCECPGRMILAAPMGAIVIIIMCWFSLIFSEHFGRTTQGFMRNWMVHAGWILSLFVYGLGIVLTTLWASNWAGNNRRSVAVVYALSVAVLALLAYYGYVQLRHMRFQPDQTYSIPIIAAVGALGVLYAQKALKLVNE